MLEGAQGFVLVFLLFNINIYINMFYLTLLREMRVCLIILMINSTILNLVNLVILKLVNHSATRLELVNHSATRLELDILLAVELFEKIM